jgi:hypothetical protein
MFCNGHLLSDDVDENTKKIISKHFELSISEIGVDNLLIEDMFDFLVDGSVEACL